MSAPFRAWLAAFALCFCVGQSVQAVESGSESSVRALILLRLAGQIYWSPSSDLGERAAAYRLCIYRNPRFFSEVQALLQGRRVEGVVVQLVQVERLEQLQDCHIADVGNVTTEDIQRIVSMGLLQNTVFVGSSAQSAEAGLHIRLYLGASGTFDVEINRAAFALGGNEPSASFLKLAGKVYESLGSGVRQ